MSTQPLATLERIAAYLRHVQVDELVGEDDQAQARAARHGGSQGQGERYPELSQRLLVGSRNQIAADALTEAVQVVRRIVLNDTSDTELRNDAMRHLVVTYLLAMAALAWEPSTDPP